MKSLKSKFLPVLALALVLGFVAQVAAPIPSAYAASDQGFAGTSAKTAAYTVLASESGTVFTNRGATGSVTFTLPSVSQGLHYLFYGVADQTFTVTAGSTIVVTFNNASATSVACSSGGQKIGAAIEAWSDGTSWFLRGTTVGVTYTVA